MQDKLSLLTAFLVLLVARSSVFAASSPTDLVISEVMYDTYYANGNDETPYEWIEIQNKGTTALTITSAWRLCDSSGCIPFPGTFTLQPGEYWLLVKGTTASAEVNLTGSFDASHTILMGQWRALANGSDVVRIYSGVEDPANLMDCVSWGSNSIECTDPNGGYGGGTDTTKSGAHQGQSISKIGTEWGYSKQVSGHTYGGSPYGPNTWSGGPTAITLSTFIARSGPRAHAVVGVPAVALHRWWLVLGTIVAGTVELLRRRGR